MESWYVVDNDEILQTVVNLLIRKYVSQGKKKQITK